ncbi:MAG: hypothetical protein WCG85_14205 [Polyangia bacterium]
MRKPISPADEESVLVRSRRRCCICFGLHRDVAVKKGQIAHLDQDNSNSSIENLAFLCFDHHDAYDSTTRSSKTFSLREVKRYRAELCEQIIPLIEKKPIATPDTYDSDETKTIKAAVLESLERSGPGIHTRYLALKLGITVRELDPILFQLAQAGALRADRKRGTLDRRYSFAGAIENRLIDAFLATLKHKVVEDVRHLRSGAYSLDAAVKTEDGVVYALETMLAKARLSRDALDRRLNMLREAKTRLGMAKAVDVIVVGISEETGRPKGALADIEASGVLVRYVDLPDHVSVRG